MMPPTAPEVVGIACCVSNARAVVLLLLLLRGERGRPPGVVAAAPGLLRSVRGVASVYIRHTLTRHALDDSVGHCHSCCVRCCDRKPS